MSQGPGAGQILVVIFLLLCGLCLTLLGGGCTAMWLFFLYSEGSVEGGFFVMSLVALAVGILLIWVGFRLLRGNPDAPPPVTPEPPNQS